MKGTIDWRVLDLLDKFISIRAPVKGTIQSVICVDGAIDISIRVPVKGTIIKRG